MVRCPHCRHDSADHTVCDRCYRALSAASAADERTVLQETLDACRSLAAAMQPLHAAGLVWLNFDPSALEATPAGLRIAKADLHVCPAGTCPDNLRISPEYSAPEVSALQAESISQATDVYHLALYAYYRLAGLLPHGFPGGGLEAFAFEIPPLRIYRPTLLPGVAPVLARALARQPSGRFDTPADFLAALARPLEQLRNETPAPLTFTTGGDTAIGRTHELAGLPNQDAWTMLSLEAGRALFIVADGVTNARVGTGERASAIAVDVLARELSELLRDARTGEEIEAALTEGFLRASDAILQQTLAEGVPAGTDPCDLMGSTALVGYLHDNVLSLAGVGDSRAYLVRDGQAEQLTVDGDVRCGELAAGAPPELVRELGAEAHALYGCLGVAEPGPDGQLVCSTHRARPAVSHWPLNEGDVVVLASDGLVEEGVYLEPAELVGLIGAEQGPAPELARRLVAAARERHRDASPWEPAGCGDDVTCIVVAVNL
jgi:protein phosphatase